MNGKAMSNEILLMISHMAHGKILLLIFIYHGKMVIYIEPEIEYYYNMNKYNEQGKKHGPWERYFSKDSLQLRIVYENGKQNGLFEQYFDNGQIQHIGHQKDGKSFGIWRHYNRCGKLHTVRKMRKAVEVELYVDYEENLVKFILS